MDMTPELLEILIYTGLGLLAMVYVTLFTYAFKIQDKLFTVFLFTEGYIILTFLVYHYSDWPLGYTQPVIYAYISLVSFIGGSIILVLIIAFHWCIVIYKKRHGTYLINSAMIRTKTRVR